MNNPPPPELYETRPAVEYQEDAGHPSTAAPPTLGPMPRKYSLAVHTVICEELKKGQRAQGACAKAGITVATFHEWIRRGKGGDPHLYQFAEDVEISYNLAEHRAVEVIQESFTGDDSTTRDVEKAQWFLERTRAEGYSKQVKGAVEVQIREFLIRLEAALPPAVFEQVLAVYLGQAPDAASLLPAHAENQEERNSTE